MGKNDLDITKIITERKVVDANQTSISELVV